MQDAWLTGRPDAERRIVFDLASDRRVWVQVFRYSGTYDSMLEGIPSAELNSRIVEEHIKTARRLAGGPVLTLVPPSRTDERGGIHLPPMSCCAALTSPPMRSEMHGSSLTVQWFAPPFFTEPLAAFVSTSLASVDWERHARDFGF